MGGGRQLPEGRARWQTPGKASGVSGNSQSGGADRGGREGEAAAPSVTQRQRRPQRRQEPEALPAAPSRRTHLLADLPGRRDFADELLQGARLLLRLAVRRLLGRGAGGRLWLCLLSPRRRRHAARTGSAPGAPYRPRARGAPQRRPRHMAAAAAAAGREGKGPAAVKGRSRPPCPSAAPCEPTEHTGPAVAPWSLDKGVQRSPPR